MDSEMWWHIAIIIVIFQWWDYRFKLWGYFLGTWFWWVVLFELGENVRSGLGLWDRKAIGTILGAVDGLPIGICDDRVIEYSEGFIDEALEDKCLWFLLLYRVCSHVRLGMFETCLYVHVCIFVEGMYTCKTGHYINKVFCFFYFCIGYVQM